MPGRKAWLFLLTTGKWDVGACLSQQCVRVAVPKLWKPRRRSPALALRADLPALEGGREGGLRERGGATREPVRVTSLSEPAQKQKGRVGARGGQTREQRKRLPRVQWGSSEQPGFVPPLPRRAEQGGWTHSSAREGQGGRRGGEAAADPGRTLGSVRPRGSLGSEDQSCLLEMSFGTWTPL